ncbi:MAB_1171c family putative transporter [Streptomyces sp. NPDC127190]|uniref:MAB_1171c family putative transporter n=1 Tax=unclassified Streptomyces TaxID=2593676 RepID=UPI00363EA322
MTISDTFWITAVVLGVGLFYKVPAVLRGGRNPLARQVGGLLIAAVGVFFFAAPSVIAAMNDLTGITNFSAPWVYSLLTGFSASCLLLIIKWRGGTPESIRRATWYVYGSYGTVALGLWICFALGDHHVERTRDFDTYYATTPWSREMILLYLLAHTVAVLLTSALLWTWESRVRGTGWLHVGVVMLTVGYAMNLLYDIAKLIPVIARWNGRDDLNWMSTDLAPPIAAVVGLLIGFGFVVPHAGERMAQRLAASREYRALAPLAQALQQVPAASSPVTISRFSSLQLRLTHRRTFVRDAVRQLHAYIDYDRREQDLRAHRSQGKTPSEAEALADAAAIKAAVGRLRSGGTQPAAPARPLADGAADLVSISRALRELPSDAVHRTAADESAVR